ncbi:unnamed protein product [Adineta ricciae]|uniref:Adenosine 3'-phospho 5'-phosphosulfate transporter 2 n=1 Tax=Adineta ricciae TaxID=249248 RepID=A0A814WMQ7_ADIRI|nr:unnamed protein product [Adineta ricciae]
MEINQGFDSLSSDSSIKPLTLSTDSLVPREHDQMPHSPSKSSLWHRYSSLPNQYSLHFLGLCAQVFVYYLGYGYLQELLFTLKGFGETAWFLTCYQFLVYSVLSFRHIGFVGLSQRRASFRSYIILAMLTLGTMGLSNYSVGYLNYPTQVMFKCCKLIPVLIGGVIIQKKTFNRYDVSAAICMSIGLIFFTLADSKVRPSFNTYGVFIICMALVADAIIGNYQEKIMKTHNVPNVEMHPVQTYGYALLFSVFGYLGIDIVLTLIKEYGALICVTVTTCRKAITIILSFILFSKPFIFDYVWSGCIVIVGIYLNVYSRNQAAFNAKIASYATSLFGAHWVSKFYSGTSTRTLSV